MKKGLYILILFLFNYSFLLAQQSGVIYGVVVDKTNQTTLPGANITIRGTAIGVITNLEGKYRLMGIPAGVYNVDISFIGFDNYTKKITINSGENIEINADLVVSINDMEEVVVTALMAGQMAAINQQLNSDALVNVVSSDKMNELPDINAAEAIGRLPGISVNRTGGEAQTISIRGFSADFTSVTLNGIKMPETGDDNRTVNLSSISPDLLSHIEVYKSPTADMDGDAMGGVISLGLLPAPKKAITKFTIESGLSTLKMKPNYKGTVKLSRRFFNNKFGAIINSSFDLTDRSSQKMSTDYLYKDETTGLQIDPSEQLKLTDVNRTINRFGLNLQLDYDYGSGNVMFQGMYNKKNTDTYTLGYEYDGLSKAVYTIADKENEVEILQLMLSGKHNFNWIEIDATLSHNQTTNKTPYNPKIEFNDSYAYLDTLSAIKLDEFSDMKDKMNYLTYDDYSDATMERMDWSMDTAINYNYTAAMNFKSDFNIGSNLAGYIKFGGKVQLDSRTKRHSPYYQRYSYDIEQAFVPDKWMEVTGNELQVSDNDRIYITNFDVQDKTSPFWNGDYSTWPYLSESTLSHWYENMNSAWRYENDELHEQYEVEERLYAGYLMAKLNIGQWLSFIPGVRYEYSDNFYQGRYSNIGGTGVNISGAVIDTAVTKQYGHLLPSAHLKLKPVKWMDFRLSYARTLKRPNYNQVVPTTRVEPSAAKLKDLGNGDLNEMIADSYDASVSFYSGKYGLLSVGVFSKVFTNYITKKSYVIPVSEAVEMGLPPSAWSVDNFPVNLPDKGYVKGYEVDLQTNFKYLPKPFNRVILNFNITQLWSSVYNEKWEQVNVWSDAEQTIVIDYDNSYFYKEEGQLTSQIDLVMNSTLGYEHKGFSFRISTQYQGVDLINTLNNTEKEFQQEYNDDWLRFDLSMSQKIGKYVKVKFFIANLTNVGEREYVYKPEYWLDDNRFGAVYQLGLECKF